MGGKKNSFGFQSYREGAIERVGDASMLLRAGQFAGAIYLAGRAVESMLRGLIWRHDADIRRGTKSLETGHDLRERVTLVRGLGLIAPGPDADQLEGRVERVARLWYNNMRFASSKHVAGRWYQLGEIRKGRTFKQAATLYFNDCSSIVKRCEALCAK